MSDAVKVYNTPMPPHPPKEGYIWSVGGNPKGEWGWFQEPREAYKKPKRRRRVGE